MSRVQSFVAVVCVFLMLAPAFGADNGSPRVAAHQLEPPGGSIGWLTRNYKPTSVPPVDLSNSSRLDSLLRAGNMYLSLQDAIALALENNLDIEIQRYGPQIADTGLLRSRAGASARSVSTGVQSGPASASATPGAAAVLSLGTSTSGTAGSSGPAIPSLDPLLTGGAKWAHTSTPQTSAFVTGTNAMLSRTDTSSVSLQQGFLTGTLASLTLNNTFTTTNNRNADFNPAKSSGLGITITQHLLQGFGTALNSRQIQIARNNREISDLTFKNQVITTVAAIMNLYWDLVSFNEDVRVKKEALALAEKLYNDNRKQVEIGTLAPIEIVRAEAEMAARQQDLTISQTQVLQQETIIKNALSRNGIASPAVADAHIIPMDRIHMPDVEPVAPIQDLVATALAARPELVQGRIQVKNQGINIKGDRNALLPSLDAVVSLNDNGLAGQFNALPLAPGRTRSTDPFFLGGYGSVLSQILTRNFPDYSAGFSLNIPIRNRTAQADLINDQLVLRQQQLGLQRMENQVRVDVQNALIGLQQSRARYQAAVKSRILQEQTVDAEQKKFALGASTIYNVILAQRDLATAQSTEVAAMNNYGKARVELDRATGQTLANNNISMAEAFQGAVSRAPSALPATPPQQP